MNFPSLCPFSKGFEKVSCSITRQRKTRSVATSLNPQGNCMTQHVICVSYRIGQISCTWLNFLRKTFVPNLCCAPPQASSEMWGLNWGILWTDAAYQGVALVPEIPSGHTHSLGWRCRWADCHGKAELCCLRKCWVGRYPAEASPGGRWVCWIAPQGQAASSTQAAGPGLSSPALASDCSSTVMKVR